ncbi:DUF4445 domain-containing protein [candidate division WOR-3 bacterium]|nr:DUF4445 domain-containing protein [candidate division WOR-3 bacterium]
MIKITVKSQGQFHVKKGTPLIDLLARKGIPIPAACNGQGRCGLCRIKIEEGARPHDEIEKLFINKQLAQQNYHLACRFYPTTDTIITIPMSPRGRAKKSVSGALALDLGTTVLKGALVDIRSKKLIRTALTFNLQSCMGGDVVTRIGRAINGEYDQLYAMLMKSIAALKRQLGVKRPLFTSVVGNTVMLSFFLKKPVDDLAGYPFKSPLDHGVFQNDPPCYIFPVIGSFIGGDIISGILASRVYSTSKNVLYADLGTNGEVVLITPKKIIAASTAAGPAFEGVGIRCGSLAVPGAIKAVGINNGIFTFSVIDNKTPLGLCASGLIDALYLGVKHGFISETGKLNKTMSIGEFSLVQNDIRKLQLAVGAIRTGMKILLKQSKLSSHMIDEVMLTGEFGTRLRPGILARIGLIPSGRMKVTSEKNLALKGAVMVLTNDRVRQCIEDIKGKSVHLELANHPEFQKEFVHAMRFSPWE